MDLFFRTSKRRQKVKKINFGVEIESTLRSDHKDDWMNHMRPCRRGAIAVSELIESCHDDCSAGVGSAEFITKVFDEGKCEEFAGQLEDNLINFEMSSKCGMHIHVDQDAFKSATAFYNVYKFINTAKYDRFIWDIAGREDGAYHERQTPKQGGYNQKYQRLSKRDAYNTYEFRLFQSTKNKDSVMRYFEFIKILVTMTNADCKLTDATIMDYASENSETFPYLNDFFQE